MTAKVCVAVIVGMLPGIRCTANGGNSSTPDSDLTVEPTTTNGAAASTTGPSVATPATAPLLFCELAPTAAEGLADLTDAEYRRYLGDLPELNDDQRRAFTIALAKAAANAVRGSGWSNEELVTVINDVCGTRLVPATLVP